MTLEQVADALDTAASQISRLETGDRPLTTKWIAGLADVYACTPEELLAGPQFLDDQERAVLAALRSLDPGQREAIEKTILGLAAMPRGKSA